MMLKHGSIRFGSVCSGIEAASVAWHPLGWEAAWLSEIEPFPSAVLTHHYPDVPNLGDMTKLPDRIRAGEVEAPDLFCGGTPCQAFSVAGLRQSLDDARGNLSLVFCEIANAIDSVRTTPSIVFWENVPGVLSTKDNAFGCFLGALAGENDALVPTGGRWTNAGFIDGPQRSIAWRVLDAQYFGVAQRRRRVFVVASARADFDPAAVLFEFGGMRRDFAPSRKAREAVAGTIASCSFSGGAGGRPEGAAGNHFVPVGKPLPAVWWDGGDVAATMTTKSDDQRMPDKDNAQLVMVPVLAPTLTASNDPSRSPQSSEVTAQVAAVFEAANSIGWSEELTASVELAGTLQRGGDGGRHDGVMTSTMQVRRLTPVECERLQGFPDNYTAIPWRGKAADQCPDGPRYKALGNSWAVPVVRWIGERIARAA